MVLQGRLEKTPGVPAGTDRNKGELSPPTDDLEPVTSPRSPNRRPSRDR